jgi:hypothetical protein
LKAVYVNYTTTRAKGQSAGKEIATAEITNRVTEEKRLILSLYILFAP